MPRMRGERRAGLVAEAGDDVDGAVGKPGLASPARPMRSDVRQASSAGLSTAALPIASAGATRAAEHLRGVVPRDDVAGDAVRLAQDRRPGSRRGTGWSRRAPCRRRRRRTRSSARWRSTSARACFSGLPVSRASSAASSSAVGEDECAEALAAAGRARRRSARPRRPRRRGGRPRPRRRCRRRRRRRCGRRARPSPARRRRGSGPRLTAARRYRRRRRRRRQLTASTSARPAFSRTVMGGAPSLGTRGRVGRVAPPCRRRPRPRKGLRRRLAVGVGEQQLRGHVVGDQRVDQPPPGGGADDRGPCAAPRPRGSSRGSPASISRSTPTVRSAERMRHVVRPPRRGSGRARRPPRPSPRGPRGGTPRGSPFEIR